MIVKIILVVLCLGSAASTVAAVYDLVAVAGTSQWVPVQAKVLEYKQEYYMTSRGQGSKQSFIPLITYQFEYNGNTYTSHDFSRRSFGKTYSGPALFSILKTVEPTSVTAFVNTKDPAQSVIDRGSLTVSIIWTLVSLIFLVMLGFLSYSSVFKVK